MANEKISELPSATPIAGDALVIARAGTNYQVAASGIAALAPPSFNVELGGNTSGTTSLVSTGTLSLAGGNNITLSQVGNGVTISAGTQGAGFSGGVSNIGNTAGNTGVTGSNLVLAGGNNVTLSQATNANG